MHTQSSNFGQHSLAYTKSQYVQLLSTVSWMEAGVVSGNFMALLYLNEPFYCLNCF